MSNLSFPFRERAITLLSALLPLMAVAAVFPVWKDLFSIALHDEEASHLFLVPLVFCWLIWNRWKQLPAFSPTGQISGLLVLTTGLLLHEIGLYWNLVVLWHASAVCCLLGALWFVTGTHVVRKAWPVFGVLIFLIPVPGLLRQQVSLPIQTYSAIATAHVLSLFGVEIQRAGCTLSVNGTLVTIVEACNGMRMLFAVFLVIYAIVFSSATRRTHQILILLFSPLLATALNAVRLVITALLYGICSADVAGLWHNINGWLIPVMLMFGSMMVAGTQQPESHVRTSGRDVSETARQARSGIPGQWSAGYRMATIAYGILAFLGVLSAGRISHASDIDAHQTTVVSRVKQVPFSIGDWLGTSGEIHREERRLLQPLAAFRRSYTHMDSGRYVTTTAFITPTARHLVGHEPGICLSGQGWEVVRQQEREWAFEYGRVRGRNYVFRSQADHRLHKQVASILVLPGGRTSGAMESVASVAADYRLNPYGAAALQVSSDHLYDDSEWRTITRDFVRAFAPVIDAFGAESDSNVRLTAANLQGWHNLAAVLSAGAAP